MGVYETLLTRLNELTAAINSIAKKAKSIFELPDATTPLDNGDYMQVSQGGVDRRALVSDFIGAPPAPGKIQFGSFQIFGASGNVFTTLQSGDYIAGLWSATEFWYLAKYNGGDVELRTNYTIYNSTEGL